ncbi:uncharacterized protein PG998_002773 [Apiospora kogelbergensis]|uniref:uncharacterized protein n=1 Tax=Apiospora kogelbergensis TaxID=1337665 RepID=UPI00312DBB07
MAPPTILVVGATGNTGRSTVETLSKLLKEAGASGPFAGHRILALTRSAQGAAARHLATLPGVEVLELDWSDVDAAWLRAQGVARAFVAAAVDPAQFARESGFLGAALRARVEYVVRVSTTAGNVRPDTEVFYARAHWAVEAMLAAPAFAPLRWTSLQPNAFAAFAFYSAAQFVQKYRQTGAQDGALRIVFDADAPVGVIDSDDIGRLAATLLVREDVAKYNHGKYVVNGPENITGRQVVEMVEKQIGVPVKEVIYNDTSLVTAMAEADPKHRSLFLTIQKSFEGLWRGEAPTSTTSKEVLEVAAPQTTPAASWEKVLKFLG